MAMLGPSVAFMKGEEGCVISLLAKKKPLVGWNYYVFALSSATKMLHQYRSELVSVQCDTCTCTMGIGTGLNVHVRTCIGGGWTTVNENSF